MLSTAQALLHLKSGAIVSLIVISYDRTRKKGGKVIEYGEAQLLQHINQPTESVRPMTKMEKHRAALRNDTPTKKPNHKHNYTRNIRLMQDGQPTSIIKKIHPLLIISMDGETVVP